MPPARPSMRTLTQLCRERRAQRHLPCPPVDSPQRAAPSTLRGFRVGQAPQRVTAASGIAEWVPLAGECRARVCTESPRPVAPGFEPCRTVRRGQVAPWWQWAVFWRVWGPWWEMGSRGRDFWAHEGSAARPLGAPQQPGSSSLPLREGVLCLQATSAGGAGLFALLPRGHRPLSSPGPASTSVVLVSLPWCPGAASSSQPCRETHCWEPLSLSLVGDLLSQWGHWPLGERRTPGILALPPSRGSRCSLSQPVQGPRVRSH